MPLTTSDKTKHMVNLNCNSTFGNFKWEASVSVTEEQAEVLASKGLLQILQRSPASEAEKSLGSYEKRPANFERKSIPFNDENATRLSKFLGNSVEIAEGVEITPTVKVTEHVIGEAVAPKFTDEKKAVQRHIDAKDVQAFATKVGFKGEGALDTENLEFLRAIRAHVDALRAAL